MSVFLVLSFSVVADLKSELQALGSLEGTTLEGPAGTLFGNVKANLYITPETGEQIIVSIIIIDKVVKSVQFEEFPEPDLKVSASEKVIREIQDAPSPVSRLQKAMLNKEITYKGVGFRNKIKFSFLSSVAKVASWFRAEEKEEMTGEKTGEKEEIDDKEVEVKAEREKKQEGEAKKIKGEAKDEETPDVNKEKEEKPAEQKTETKTDEKEVEEKNEIEVEVSSIGATHQVEMTAGGFSPTELTVNAGDTVVWENKRSGNLNKGMVLGSRQCVYVKSGIFLMGEKFSYTFTKPETCVIVDGILTTQTMTVTVKE